MVPGNLTSKTINIHEARAWSTHYSQVKLLQFYQSSLSHTLDFRPHFGSPRKIHEGQKIHSSFLLADKLINGQAYTPKACPVGDNPVFWQNARKHGLGQWLELDLYEYIDKLVKGFVDMLDIDLLECLNQTASWRKQILFGRKFLR